MAIPVPALETRLDGGRKSTAGAIQTVTATALAWVPAVTGAGTDTAGAAKGPGELQPSGEAGNRAGIPVETQDASEGADPAQSAASGGNTARTMSHGIRACRAGRAGSRLGSRGREPPSALAVAGMAAKVSPGITAGGSTGRTTSRAGGRRVARAARNSGRRRDSGVSMACDESRSLSGRMASRGASTESNSRDKAGWRDGTGSGAANATVSVCSAAEFRPKSGTMGAIVE